jgi:hypothetical protein
VHGRYGKNNGTAVMAAKKHDFYTTEFIFFTNRGVVVSAL